MLPISCLPSTCSLAISAICCYCCGSGWWGCGGADAWLIIIVSFSNGCESDGPNVVVAVFHLKLVIFVGARLGQVAPDGVHEEEKETDSQDYHHYQEQDLWIFYINASLPISDRL